MPIGEICTREVIVARRDITIEQAAELMRVNHVGDLLIVEDFNGDQVPVGILTDRDIAVAVVAMKLDPASLSAGDVMTQDPATATEDQSVLETIQQMRAAGVRRLPVVTGRGALVGIVSTDDVIQLLAEEITELAKLIVHEQRKEVQTRR